MNKCIAEVYLRLADSIEKPDTTAILNKANYGFVKIKAVFLQWGLDVCDDGSYTVGLVELEEFEDDVIIHSTEAKKCVPGRVFTVAPDKITFLNHR